MRSTFKYSLTIFLFIITANLYSQQGIEFGSPGNVGYGTRSGFFDFSDPKTLNVSVSVWGYVPYPGKYLIPIYTTPADLLSFAGGPTEEADLDDIRLYRLREDGTEEILKLQYDDLLYSNKLDRSNRTISNLKPGDILIVPGGPKYYFREWLSIALSIFSALVSLTILILNLNK